MNMIFVYVDREFFGSSVGYVEEYNEFLKKKPRPSFADKAKILGEYYQQIKDVNVKGSSFKKCLVLDECGPKTTCRNVTR